MTPEPCWNCDGAGWLHAETGDGELRYRFDRRTGQFVPRRIECEDCEGSGKTCSDCGAPWSKNNNCTSCEASHAA